MIIIAHKQHLDINYSLLARWHQGEQTVTLSLEPEPVPCAIHLALEGFPGLFVFHRLVDPTSFSYISKGNRLPTFQPAASSCQQKLWFDSLALYFWRLIDTAVLGSSWHSVPAAKLPQAVSSSGPHAEKGPTDSEFRWATLQGQPPRSTIGLVVHEACCLFTPGLDRAQPLCQGHSCLPSLRSLGPC